MLKPLPSRPYQLACWKKAQVNIDYHVELGGHWYSVPYTLVGKPVEVRHSNGCVEVFLTGRRVASHVRSAQKGRIITQPEHMLASHRQHAEWTPSRLIRWAEGVGPSWRSWLSATDLVGLLADAAWMYRENKKLSARLQHAKLRQQACLEDIDYTHARGLTNPQVLSTSKWGAGKHNVLLTGPTVWARASWRALGMRSLREVRLAASPLCPCPI